MLIAKILLLIVSSYLSYNLLATNANKNKEFDGCKNFDINVEIADGIQPCDKLQWEKYNRELNKLYKELLLKLNPKERHQLIEDERA